MPKDATIIDAGREGPPNRYPISLQLHYKATSKHGMVVGFGQTTMMSSQDIIFAAGGGLEPGMAAQIALALPFLLDDRIPLRLALEATITVATMVLLRHTSWRTISASAHNRILFPQKPFGSVKAMEELESGPPSRQVCCRLPVVVVASEIHAMDCKTCDDLLADSPVCGAARWCARVPARSLQGFNRTRVTQLGFLTVNRW